MFERRRGFTMIELVIVIAITAILVALAAPSMREAFARRTLEGAATDLNADLQYARSQAVAEFAGSTVSLLSENGGTQYRVFKTVSGVDTTLKTVVLPTAVTVTNNVTATFDQLRGMAASAVQYDLASAQTSATMRLNVNATGRTTLCSPGGTLKGHVEC